MSDGLTRSPTFGAETGGDDWSIRFEGVGIGRIYRQRGGLPGPPWHWEIAILSHRGPRRGACATFDEARAAFAASWRQLRGQVHEAELRSELAARRATEARNDAWAERHRGKPR